MSTHLAELWRGWLAPELQPFYVQHTDIGSRALPSDGQLTRELRDTYEVWNVDDESEIVWLDEHGFRDLPKAQRARLVQQQHAVGRGAVPRVVAWADLIDPTLMRAQADGRRFVWWPSLLEADPFRVFQRLAAHEHLPSQHGEVSAATWARCSAALSRAREFAGTFADGSGPNCFGTVMAAAGVCGADTEWMLQAPFDTWLSTRARRGGRDTDPGTILVWRTADGTPVHAAVTLGDGWALEKSSQRWISPRAVLSVRDVIRTSRAAGQRLHRYRLNE